MLTALNIEEYDRRGVAGLLSRMRRNRVRVEHLYCDCAAVRSISYEHRRGRVSWQSVERFVRSERGQLLCPEGLELPDGCGFRRFESRELSRRLCENAALWLLREADDPRARAALIDPFGECVGLCSYLTDHTDCLRVVTDDPEVYLKEAERLLDERGAVIHIGRGDEPLLDADLIIAPSPPGRAFSCPPDAIILSGERPSCSFCAPVIYDYTIELPSKLIELRPQYLDEMYFASALYSLAGVHELGSQVFRRCSDDRVVHTRQSLLGQFRQRLAARE